MRLQHFFSIKKSLGWLLFFGFLFFSINSYADDFSPVGTWRTVDDTTGKPRSIVQIWNQNNELIAKISQVFYGPGEGTADVCKKCTGSFHNQLILGMTIVWGMTNQGNNTWAGGRILDPHNGKIYRCKMILSHDGQQLLVRGYIGMPILGRSQTWLRLA